MFICSKNVQDNGSYLLKMIRLADVNFVCVWITVIFSHSNEITLCQCWTWHQWPLNTDSRVTFWWTSHLSCSFFFLHMCAWLQPEMTAADIHPFSPLQVSWGKRANVSSCGQLLEQLCVRVDSMPPITAKIKGGKASENSCILWLCIIS